MTTLRCGKLYVGNTRQSSVLSADDFTFSGYYTYGSNLEDGMTFSGQITHRYVDGELRFLAMAHASGAKKLIEFKLPFGAADGREITSTQKTNTWLRTEVWQTIDLTGHHLGIWWEDLGEGTGRLWGTMGVDYAGVEDQKHITRSVTVRDLNDDGTVSNFKGPWGFQGVSQRCVYGKVQKNPQWFQDTYGVGPYLYGFGGYASLQVAGGLTSLGLFAISASDLSEYPDNEAVYGTGGNTDWNVPNTDFDILADHRSGLQHGDWDTTQPPGWDRGHRLTLPKNFYEASNTGIPPNGSGLMEAYYETHNPDPGSGWTSPGPDGEGRWVWGDSYYSTCCWIDGASKKGLVCVASLTDGWAGYVDSKLSGEKGAAEIHIFDPSHLGEVKNGTRDAWNVQPVAMKNITPQLGSLGLTMFPRGLEQGGPVAATFDSITKKLWITFTATDGGYGCALLCYGVNC